MSLLYKDPKDIKISVEIRQDENSISFLFFADMGKHGTDEIIDEFDISADELLKILRQHRVNNVLNPLGK